MIEKWLGKNQNDIYIAMYIYNFTTVLRSLFGSNPLLYIDSIVPHQNWDTSAFYWKKVVAWNVFRPGAFVVVAYLFDYV